MKNISKLHMGLLMRLVVSSAAFAALSVAAACGVADPSFDSPTIPHCGEKIKALAALAGPIPPTGNTNTHGLFKPDVRTFLRRWSMEGPTHHFALGVGHHAAEIKKLGKALGIEAVVVTEGK